MAVASVIAPEIATLGDLLRHLGGVSLDRIRFRPFPGTATLQDVVEIREREGKRCELIAGVLLEKTVGFNESTLAIYLAGLLNAFVIPRNLGVVAGPDGTMELAAGLVRIPDVAFMRWDRFPNRRRPSSPIPRVAPNLAIEVLSQTNTASEMAAKRQDYFTAGVELVWEIAPESKTVDVYLSPSDATTLGPADVLTGGAVLPGFSLEIRDLFEELDRQG